MVNQKNRLVRLGDDTPRWLGFQVRVRIRVRVRVRVRVRADWFLSL